MQVGNLLDRPCWPVSRHMTRVRRNLLIYFDQRPSSKCSKCSSADHVDGVCLRPEEGSRWGVSAALDRTRSRLPQSSRGPNRLRPFFSGVLPTPLPLRCNNRCAVWTPPPVRSRPFATVVPMPQVAPTFRKPSFGRRKAAGDKSPRWPTKAKVPRPARACEVFCAVTNRWPRCSIGGAAQRYRRQRSRGPGFYRKALYLETATPRRIDALGRLVQSQGDTAGARRLQARAARSERAADSERKR